LKIIFEQLEVFESIVGFLFDARTLKSLDNDEFKKVLLIFFVLKILQISLSHVLMLGFKMFEFVKSFN